MRPVAELLAELRASVADYRAEHGLPEPQPRYEPPLNREEWEGLRAEERAADRRLGDPGNCPI